MCSIKEGLNAYFFFIGFYYNNKYTYLITRVSPYFFTYVLYLILVLLNIIDEEKDDSGNPKFSLSKELNSYLNRRYYFTKKINEKFIASLIFLLLILKLNLIFIILYSIMIILYFTIRCLKKYRKNYILRLKIIFWYLIVLTIIESVICFLNLNEYVLNESLIKEGYNNFIFFFKFENFFPISQTNNDNHKNFFLFGQNLVQINSLIINLLIIYSIFFYFLNFLKEAEYINDEYKKNEGIINIDSFYSELKEYSVETQMELYQTIKYASRYGEYYENKLKNELEFLKEKDKFISFERMLTNDTTYKDAFGLKKFLNKKSNQNSKVSNEKDKNQQNFQEKENNKNQDIDVINVKNYTSEEVNDKNKNSLKFPFYKKFIFAHSVYFILICLLFFCYLNPCLVNFPYVFFGFYYILIPDLVLNYKPHSFRKILLYLLTWLIFEFILVAIYQIYDDFFDFNDLNEKSKEEIMMFLNIFFNRLKFIKNGNRDEFEIDPKVLIYIVIKIIKIFLILIQLKIFKSEEFKYFFLYNKIKNTFSFKKKGILIAYEYNNNRFNKHKNNHDFIEFKTNQYNFLKHYDDKDYILNEEDKITLKKYLKEVNKNKENSKNLNFKKPKFSKESREELNNSFDSIKNEIKSENLNKIEDKNEKEFELIKVDHNSTLNLKINEKIKSNDNEKINEKVKKYNHIQSIILNSIDFKSVLTNHYKYNLSDLKKAFSDGNIRKFINEHSLKLMQLFIYVNFFLYSVFKSNLIDAVYIILIISYSSILYPRAISKFWNFLIYIIFANLLIQYLIQILFKLIITDKSLEVFFKTIINFIIIINEENRYHIQIFYYFWSFYFIFLLIIYRIMLIKNGLWEKIEPEYEKLTNIEQRIQDYRDYAEDLSEITDSNIKQKKKMIDLFLYVQFELDQEDLFNYKMKEYLKNENKDLNISNTKIYLSFKKKEQSIKNVINELFKKGVNNSLNKNEIKNKLLKYIFYLDFLGDQEYYEKRIKIKNFNDEDTVEFKEIIKDILKKNKVDVEKELNALIENINNNQEMLNKMINILKIIFIKINFRENNKKSPKLYRNIIRKYQVR